MAFFGDSCPIPERGLVLVAANDYALVLENGRFWRSLAVGRGHKRDFKVRTGINGGYGEAGQFQCEVLQCITELLLMNGVELGLCDLLKDFHWLCQILLRQLNAKFERLSFVTERSAVSNCQWRIILVECLFHGALAPITQGLVLFSYLVHRDRGQDVDEGGRQFVAHLRSCVALSA